MKKKPVTTFDWWVYRLFKKRWDPIFAANPKMARAYVTAFEYSLDKSEASKDEGPEQASEPPKRGSHLKRVK